MNELDECSEWYEICSQFKMTMSGVKYCIGKTLFYNSDFMTDWESSRSYCSGIFHGYRRADLLYYDEKSDPDSDLELLLENYHPNNPEFPTSALCCPIINNNGDHYSTTLSYSIECKWLHNGEIIPEEYYRDVSFENIDECKFLMVNLLNGFKPKFSR